MFQILFNRNQIRETIDIDHRAECMELLSSGFSTKKKRRSGWRKFFPSISVRRRKAEFLADGRKENADNDARHVWRERGVIQLVVCSFAQVLGSGPGFKGSALESSRSAGDGNLEWISRTGSQMSSQRRLQISRGHAPGHGQTWSMDFRSSSGKPFF